MARQGKAWNRERDEMQAPHPDSNSTPSRGEPAPQVKSGGGEVTLSAAEAAALAALEADGDNYGRAIKDSGLSADQVRTLKVRAQRMRSKGYTLRGQSHVFKAHSTMDPDQHGLIGSSAKKPDATAKPAAKPAAKSTREASLDEMIDARKAAIGRALEALRAQAQTQTQVVPAPYGSGSAVQSRYYYIEQGTLDTDHFVAVDGSSGPERRYYRIPYAIKNGEAVLGDWVQVERAWKPVKLSQK